MYLGKDPNFPIRVRPSVLALFDAARERLEAAGAEVVETGFPLIEQYEGDRPGQENVGELGVLPEGWMDTEFNHFLAFGWDDFLRANGDPAIPDLGVVDPDRIFPQPPGALPDRYEEVEDYENRYRATVGMAKGDIQDPRERADFADGLRGLVQLRGELFESWLETEGFDGVVFPANADVGAANADVDLAAADHAWSNGVFFSNGNYAIRHLGIPTVTVAMGVMADIGMPVGLTFAGRAYDDQALLAYATAFESAADGTLRTPPPQYSNCYISKLSLRSLCDLSRINRTASAEPARYAARCAGHERSGGAAERRGGRGRSVVVGEGDRLRDRLEAVDARREPAQQRLQAIPL